MSESKQLAEKIHMFYNLLYHIDDYINNKKERKDQLRVSKHIRLVLREIITSQINLNYFIKKEELVSYKRGGEFYIKKSKETIEKEKEYIKQINPLSFNQKNLHTINLFYNSTNEIYVINYFSIEKIFNIIRFCFKNIISQKHKEYQDNLERNKKNKNFFLLNDNNEYNSNTILVKMVKSKVNILKSPNDTFFQYYISNGKVKGLEQKNLVGIIDKKNINNIASFNANNSCSNIYLNSNKSVSLENNNKIHNQNYCFLPYQNTNIKRINKNISLPIINVKNNNLNFYPSSLIKSSFYLPIYNRSFLMQENKKLITLYKKVGREKSKENFETNSNTASIKCFVNSSKNHNECIKRYASIDNIFCSHHKPKPTFSFGFEYKKSLPLFSTAK